MRLAHLADVHIGAWRDPRMKDLPILAFENAVTIVLERQCDVALICGDLFNTSLPPLDMVKRAVAQLQRLRKANIPVYAIAGSHDYSPSGKTMLDVLEEAHLLVNVMKGEIVEEGGKQLLRLRFTRDEKTGAKLAGILGRAGSLDRHYYEDLDRASLEAESGEKIFLFHAAITELKPKELERMESSPASILPKGFSYYAGGHVHIVGETQLPGYARLVYPGPLYPASFSELEELGNGGFCIVEDGKIERIALPLRERLCVRIDVDGKSVEEANAALQSACAQDVRERILLVRVEGVLREGRASDLRLREFVRDLFERGAFAVMKNTAKLSSTEFEEFSAHHGTAQELEEQLIREHAGQSGLAVEEEVALARELFAILSEEQHEGEKKYEYEERVVRVAKGRLVR